MGMGFETLLTREQIERYTREGYWGSKVITDFLDEAAEKTPDKLAAVDGRSRYTYRELRQLVDRCALGFLELGVRPGDVVSFQLPNWNEWVIAHFAATRIGAISNPLVPIYRDREIRFMLGLAEPKIMVIPDRFRNFSYPEMMERLRPSMPFLRHILVVGDEVPLGQESWKTFMETKWEKIRDPGELAALRPDANEVTELIFTSGTTGEPKGVLHTHNTVISTDVLTARLLNFDADTVIHMASTFAHQTGFLYGPRLVTYLGSTGIYQDIWNVERFVEMVEEFGIHMTMGATPFLHDLVRAPNLDQHDLSSLRVFICAGAPIPRPLLREARKRLPGVAVLGGWGQTEDALVTLSRMGDSEEKITSTDGLPVPGMEVRVVDGSGRLLPPGQPGRLQCKGPFLFVGYAKRLEMTRASFDGEWFDTGDFAVIDEEGYVSIEGRAKDIIIRGGENIPVTYVENVLHEHPDIEQVAIVAMPDPHLQERACAFVILKSGATLTLADLQQFLQEKGVAKPYWPERVEVVDEFPRTASGKIQKFKLREEIARQLQREGEQ